MSHAMDRRRRRRRSHTFGAIVLTALLAVCGATLSAVAVSLVGLAPSIGKIMH